MRTGVGWGAKKGLIFVALGNIVVIGALTIAVTVVFHRSSAWQYDLGVYRNSVVEFVHGRPLYDNDLGFTYPPFAAILLAPLALTSPAVAAVVVLVVSLLLLEFSVWRLLTWTGWPAPGYRLPVALVLTAIFAWLDPCRTTLMLGQVSFLILAVTTYDLAKPDSSRSKGIGVGLMTGFKLVPVVFIGYFLVTRRWRSAATAALTTLGTVGLSLAVAPSDTLRYWGSVLYQSNRIGQAQDVFSESIESILVRWEKSYDGVLVPSLVLSVVVVAVGFFLAWLAFQRDEEPQAVAACGVIVVLVLPIAWTFYWVWPLVPLLVRLLRSALAERSRFAAAVLVVLAVEFFAAPSNVALSRTEGGELAMTRWELLMTSTHAATAVVVLLAIGVHLARRKAAERARPLSPVRIPGRLERS